MKNIKYFEAKDDIQRKFMNWLNAIVSRLA